MKTTYLPYNAETGNYPSRTEYECPYQASLAALGDAFDTTFEMRRRDDGYAELFEGEKPVFLTGTFERDDTQALRIVLSQAHKCCSDSGQRMGDVLTIVRDDAGRIINLDPDVGLMEDDRQAYVAEWTKRLA